jgi:hypothetical protein
MQADDLKTLRLRLLRCWEWLSIETDPLARSNLVFLIREFEREIARLTEADGTER